MQRPRAATAMTDHDPIDHFKTHGYAIVRGFFTRAEIDEYAGAVDTVYTEALKHHATYRDRNLLLEVAYTGTGKRVAIQAHWASWINTVMEQQRRSPRYCELLGPLLGKDIKQITNQIHWKPPGMELSGYRYHQDLRFRERTDVFPDLMNGYVTTGVAIDRQDSQNGALSLFPDSHKLGYLGLSDEGDTIMKGLSTTEELRSVGLDPDTLLTCELEPGDLVMWGLYTVHGSLPNHSNRDRRFLLNSYCLGESTRGEWAFIGGVSTPLGESANICRYEALHTRPGPFYIEDQWYRD